MIKRGHIKINVTNSDLGNLIFKDYLPCYRQTAKIKQYYNSHNSSIWQMLNESPQWVHDLARKIPQDFHHHVVSVIKNDPGQIIPYHVDRHSILKETYGGGSTFRYLVFLQDWKPGHYFEIQKQSVTNWKAGDWIKFHRNAWHLGGNLGQEPFFSAQITVK